MDSASFSLPDDGMLNYLIFCWLMGIYLGSTFNCCGQCCPEDSCASVVVDMFSVSLVIEYDWESNCWVT